MSQPTALSDMSAGILDGPSGYEPQRTNNGLIYLNLPNSISDAPLQLAVKMFDNPRESNAVVSVSHLNENRKYAGRVEYAEVQCTMYDYIDLDTAGFIAAWRQLVYNPANGKIGWKRNYASTGFLDKFGPNGQYVRSYQLIGAWPSQYDPGGQFDQEGDQTVLINLTITIDKAIPLAAIPSSTYTTA